MGILRVAGEGFDADQTEILCDDCGRDQYGCHCELVEDVTDDCTDEDDEDLVEFVPRSSWGLTTPGRDGIGVWC